MLLSRTLWISGEKEIFAVRILEGESAAGHRFSTCSHITAHAGCFGLEQPLLYFLTWQARHSAIDQEDTVRARFSTTFRSRIWNVPHIVVHSIPARVLVVDDFIDSADALAAFLAIIGFDTRVAYNGGDALKMAREWHPDGIVLDIVMPDVSGLAVARALRAAQTTSSIPLLAYTACDSDNNYDELRNSGLDAVCSKPADPVDVARLLGILLGTIAVSRAAIIQ